MNTELDQAFQEIFDAELITPESQAWADYIDGKGLEANPYTEHSLEHGRYVTAMSREFQREQNRSVEP